MRKSAVYCILLIFFSAFCAAEESSSQGSGNGNVLGPGYYEESDPSIIYTGSWSSGSSSQASQNNYRYSTDQNSKVEFYFEGDTLTIYRITSPMGSDIKICIDSECSTVSYYSTTYEFMIPKKFEGLGGGTHRATIQKTMQNSLILSMDSIEIKMSSICGNNITESGEQCDNPESICCSSSCQFYNPGQTSCGAGECKVTIDRCTNGFQNICTPYPPTEEVCDGKDNDCDGSYDEGILSRFYRDGDDDGFGNINYYTETCTRPSGYAASQNDCDDSDPASNPMAAEICNGKDDDCDGSIDDGIKTWYYRDDDRDGYGGGPAFESCSIISGYLADSTDCDDANSRVNPAALETCDSADNDCDGVRDEGCSCTDGSRQDCGFNSVGNCRLGSQYCTGGSWSACTGQVNPGIEVCDGLDNNCNGNADENLLNDCMDYSTCQRVKSCSRCEDAPTEICDGRDNDCDGQRDEDLSNCCFSLGEERFGCSDDLNCPGTAGKNICENFEWSSCRAECPIIINETSFSMLNELSSVINLQTILKEEMLCEGSMTKTLDLSGFKEACLYRVGGMVDYEDAPPQLKVEFTIGENVLNIRCGNVEQKIVYTLRRQQDCNTSSKITDFEKVISEFVSQGIIDEGEKKQAQETLNMVSEKTSLLSKSDSALVTHSLQASKDISDMEYRLYIPKECANDTSMIDFYMKNFTILNDDPLIAWHFVDVKGKIDLSYRIKGNIKPECLDKIKGLPIARIDDRLTKGNGTGKNLFLPLLLIIIIAGGTIFMENKHANSEALEAAKADKDKEIVLEKIKAMEFKSKEEAISYMEQEGMDNDTRDYIGKRL